MSSTPEAPRSVGLVLGAGGVPGWAYLVGALAALETVTGWDPRRADLLVGTSAGAGVASLLRGGLSADDQLAIYQQRPLSEAGQALHDRAEAAVAAQPAAPPLPDVPASQVPAFPVLAARGLLRWPPRPGVVLAGAMPRGRRDHDDLRRRLDAIQGPSWPAAPLWVTAVRVRDGRRVAFGRDAAPVAGVGEAVAASAAVPGWYEPVRIGAEHYVDGAMWSTTNADLGAGLGLDLVVVVAPMSSESPRRSWDGAAVRRAWHRGVLAKEAQVIREHGSAVVVFEPGAADIEAMATDEVDRETRRGIAERAHAAVVARLAADATLAATFAGAATAEAA
jgi:NTE family protein